MQLLVLTCDALLMLCSEHLRASEAQFHLLARGKETPQDCLLVRGEIHLACTAVKFDYNPRNYFWSCALRNQNESDECSKDVVYTTQRLSTTRVK